MKHAIKIFFLLLSLGSLKNTKAQQYSASDNKILNDIEAFIITTAVSDTSNYQKLINYGEGVIAKDTNVLLYNAYQTETLHADRYSVFNYFNDSIFLYNCLYANKNNVLLVIKAMDRILKYSKGDWEVKAQKSIEDNDSVPYLFYKKKKIAFFQKSPDNTLLRLAFISMENNTEDVFKIANHPVVYLTDFKEKLADIDSTIKPDNEKIVSIQNSIIDILSKGKKWFSENIGIQTSKNTAATFYQASAVNKMYAQEYKATKKTSDNALYYMCTYTNAVDEAAAMNAIDGLPAIKRSTWMITRYMHNKSYEIQKLYLKNVYVGYTTYFNIIKQFDVYIKKID